MGSNGYSTDCWKCGGKDTIMANTDNIPFDSSDGVCLKCGWHYWTETGQMTKKELKELRKDFDYKPQTKKQRIMEAL